MPTNTFKPVSTVPSEQEDSTAEEGEDSVMVVDDSAEEGKGMMRLACPSTVKAPVSQRNPRVLPALTDAEAEAA